MYVACSSLCFGRIPLAQALHSISEMNFNKVDLALHESGSHLKPSDVVADLNKAATLLRKANVGYAAFHVELDAPDRDTYLEQFRAVCRLARMLAVPLVNIKASPLGTDLEEELKRLNDLNRIAQSEGVLLTVETHSQTLTAEPSVALMMCERIPGLGITLDPSHYLLGPNGERDYDELYPFVEHVRLRDTSPDKLQVRVGQGKIEYGKIISSLERERYKRALSVDIHDVPDAPQPMDQEIRKLKYLLESMV